jgi:mono/diheme cytochrome c family protein
MKYVYLVAFVATSALFSYCNASKKATASKPTVTYTDHIAQVVVNQCGPCHIAGKGKLLSLDNYENLSQNIDEVISRIERYPGEKGYMPAKRERLSDSDIQLFKTWKA